MASIDSAPTLPAQPANTDALDASESVQTSEVRSTPSASTHHAHVDPTPSSHAGTVTAVLAVIAMLWWAKSFLIPVSAGLMLAMLVLPVAALLTRWLHCRVCATTITLMIVMVLLGAAGAAFGDQIGRVARRVPDMISLVAQQVSKTEPGADSVLQRAREAFVELDRAAERLSGAAAKAPQYRTARAKAEAMRQASLAASAEAAAATPPINIAETATVALRDTAVSGSGALFKFAGDLTIIFFVAFFVLNGGPPLADRFLGLWGDRPGLRLRAEHTATECVRQIRIYGVVLLITNTVVGLAVWAAFSFSGLPDAAGWAHRTRCRRGFPGPWHGRRRARHGRLPGADVDADRNRRHRLATKPRGQDERHGRVSRCRVLGRDMGRMGPAARPCPGRAVEGGGRTLPPRAATGPLDEGLMPAMGGRRVQRGTCARRGVYFFSLR